MRSQDRTERLIEGILTGATSDELDARCGGLDLDQAGVHGRTPLMVAAAEGLLSAAQVLVRNGASVHASGRGRMTALHEASANGDVAVVGFLLSLGADVDAETIDGVTPLMCAAAWGHADAVRLLLESGANPRKRAHRGDTAADIAGEKSETMTADLINARSGPRRS